MSLDLALWFLCAAAGAVAGVLAVSALDHRRTVHEERKLRRWNP